MTILRTVWILWNTFDGI